MKAALAVIATAVVAHARCNQMVVVEQTLWPDHCVQGTLDAQLHNGLERATGNVTEVILKKGDRPNVDSYSAFKDNAGGTETELDSLLKAGGFKNLYIAGLATDFCVWFTASDGASLGYNVSVVEDASRAIFPEAVLKLKSASAEMKNPVSWTVADEVKGNSESALLVIDVQNCFSSTGSLPVGKFGTETAGESVVPMINELRRTGDWGLIVYTQDWHLPNQTSFASQHAHDGLSPFQTHEFLCHNGDCCRSGDTMAHIRDSEACQCVVQTKSDEL